MQGISEVKKEEPLAIQQDLKYRRKSAKSERNHTEASALQKPRDRKRDRLA